MLLVIIIWDDFPCSHTIDEGIKTLPELLLVLNVYCQQQNLIKERPDKNDEKNPLFFSQESQLVQITEIAILYIERWNIQKNKKSK